MALPDVADHLGCDAVSAAFYFLRGLAIGCFLCAIPLAVYGFLCAARGYLSEGREVLRQLGFGALWLGISLAALLAGVGAAVWADHLR